MAEGSGRTIRGGLLQKRPKQRGVAAELRVDDEVIVGHEGAADLRILDFFASEVWHWIDGRVTAGELAEDIADSTGLPVHEATDGLVEFLDSLEHMGFVEDWRVETPDVQRRPLIPIPPESCLGKRIGLSTAEVAHVRIPLSSGALGTLRVASTDPGEVADLLGALQPLGVTQITPDETSWVETIIHRAPVGRVPRVQQIFGTGGEMLHSTRDPALSERAFNRTVTGLCQAMSQLGSDSPSAWLFGPSLATDRGVVLVHPALHDAVFTGLRDHCRRQGYAMTPSAMIRLTTDGIIESAGDPTDADDSDRAWPLLACLMPRAETGSELARRMLHLAWRWDQVHFDAIGRAAELSIAAFVDDGCSLEDLSKLIDEVTAV